MRSLITGCWGIKMKKERGSITLEASIFLSMFLMFYVALMDLVQIGRAQMIMQYTLNETAKEISQCTYILTKAGIVDERIQTSQKSKQFKERTEEMIDSVSTLVNTIGNGGDVIGQARVTGENVSDYFENSEEITDGVIAVVKNLAANLGSEVVIGEICKGSLNKQLSYLSGDDLDAYLKKLGVENISFSGTKWFDGSRELDIVMTYEVRYNLGFLGEQKRVFKARAKTAIW